MSLEGTDVVVVEMPCITSFMGPTANLVLIVIFVSYSIWTWAYTKSIVHCASSVLGALIGVFMALLLLRFTKTDEPMCPWYYDTTIFALLFFMPAVFCLLCAAWIDELDRHINRLEQASTKIELL